MIALHARRSADSIARFAQAGGEVTLVLTGTDLYRDIATDPQAQRSLQLARQLVVLQAQGLEMLPTALRSRARVIVQSAPALPALPPRRRTDDLALVGHVRPEKDPLTALRALALLRHGEPCRERLRLRLVGGDRDAALYQQVRALAAHDPRVELMGALPHGRARRVIRQSRALLLPSIMEGGANVLIEAVTSDVPVLASAIGGSIGLLGADYPGLFPVGDVSALAALIARVQDDPDFVSRLREHGRCRAPAFHPDRERDAVLALVTSAALGPARPDAAPFAR